jgi:hypothetical protein
MPEMVGSSGSGVTAHAIQGMATLAFKAKMKSNQVRDYIAPLFS